MHYNNNITVPTEKYTRIIRKSCDCTWKTQKPQCRQAFASEHELVGGLCASQLHIAHGMFSAGKLASNV